MKLTSLLLLGALSLGAFAASYETVHTEKTRYYEIKFELVAEGLSVPWAVLPMADGRIFITERPGRLRVVIDGVLQKKPYYEFEEVVDRGQGGLLDITPHPNYAKNRWLYLTYVTRMEDNTFMRVVRMKDTGDTLTDPKTIYDLRPDEKPKHFGGRLRFGPDGKLYVSTGERGKWDYAQELTNANGKVLRLNDDGSIPGDNPFVGRKDALPEIYSYGNRNIQGMDFDPESGVLYVAEHGPSGNDRDGGGDEINIIQAGKNYGWPIIHHDMQKPGMESPLIQFTPATAPGGAALYHGTLFKEWKGDLLVANLRGRKMQRVRIREGKVTDVEEFFTDFGRLRALYADEEGYVYVSTSGWDGIGWGRFPRSEKILRLSPAK